MVFGAGDTDHLLASESLASSQVGPKLVLTGRPHLCCISLQVQRAALGLTVEGLGSGHEHLDKGMSYRSTGKPGMMKADIYCMLTYVAGAALDAW